MEFVTGVKEKEAMELPEVIVQEEGTEVIVEGAIHSIRNMGEIAFVILRKRDGLIQTVWEENKTNLDISELKEAACVSVKGVVKDEERVRTEKKSVWNKYHFTQPAAPLPLAIDKWKLNTSLETKLDMRSVSLRNLKERARFKIQEAICRGFREYLYAQGFTEIHTPKMGQKAQKVVPICLS